MRVMDHARDATDVIVTFRKGTDGYNALPSIMRISESVVLYNIIEITDDHVSAMRQVLRTLKSSSIIGHKHDSHTPYLMFRSGKIKIRDHLSWSYRSDELVMYYNKSKIVFEKIDMWKTIEAIMTDK